MLLDGDRPMRKSILLFWILLPVAAVAYHMGPGQVRMIEDDAATLIAEASRHAGAARAIAAEAGDEAARAEWERAEASYAKALQLLPDGQREAHRALRLERAKAQMFLSRLPDAHQELKTLVNEMVGDETAGHDLLADARSTLASSQYYMTWLMRLEGASREDWEPEIESARQIYKLLAEDAKARDDHDALEKNQQDLGAAILLARMDLGELQGLPLPSQ